MHCQHLWVGQNRLYFGSHVSHVGAGQERRGSHHPHGHMRHSLVVIEARALMGGGIKSKKRKRKNKTNSRDEVYISTIAVSMTQNKNKCTSQFLHPFHFFKKEKRTQKCSGKEEHGLWRCRIVVSRDTDRKLNLCGTAHRPQSSGPRMSTAQAWCTCQCSV